LLTAEINALKFRYRINIGITQPKAEVIKTFAVECIRLIETSAKSKLRLSDACYLAVSALIRLYELENDMTYLFQAAYLLEAGPVSEDAHPGKVLLVYLETELGLHSLAMKQYVSLRVREIQQETMAHSLLTRVSINHPFALDQRGETSVDPYEMVDKALDMFFATDKKLANSQTLLMKQGQCDLVFELQDLRDTLERSLTRRMLILEQCRIARLTDNPFHPRTPDIHPSVLEYWTRNLKDSRDYAETFNFDGVGRESTPERRLHSGGKVPNSNWISLAIVSEDVWSLLSNRSTVCSKPSSVTEEEATTMAEAGDNELTDTEKCLAKPWAQLLQATKSLLGSNETTKPDTGLLDRLVTSMQQLSIPDSLDTQSCSGLAPSSKTLQAYFLVLDLLRSTALFCNVAAEVDRKKRAGNRLAPQAVQHIRDAASKHFTAVQQLAREQKAKVDGRDMVQALRKGEIGDAMCEAKGLGQGLRGFAAKAEASALDAWDGVGKVRLGLK
jgi:N-terminal acetyltransferase B complex non-catalytic subunit